MIYEKSSSVTFGGYALLPKGENLEFDPPPKKDRLQPLIEKAAVVKRTRAMEVTAVGGMESRWAVL